MANKLLDSRSMTKSQLCTDSANIITDIITVSVHSSDRFEFGRNSDFCSLLH